MPVHDVLILMAMAHKNMREHHLGHPDGASPASIVAVSDLKVTTYIPGQRQEPLCQILLFAFEQWLVTTSVTEPN